jgi:hypothetical protein
MHVKTRRTAVAVLTFVGLVLFAKTTAVQAIPVSPLQLVGSAVADEPVFFSVTGAIPSTSARIVVIPGALTDRSGPAPLVFACYSGTPAALGTADVTTDASGNVGPVQVWTSATPGSYVAYLLQGTCADASTGGRSAEASSDARIVGEDGFTVGADVPALSGWGLAALGLALSIAGWAFLFRTRA